MIRNETQEFQNYAFYIFFLYLNNLKKRVIT